VLDPLRCRRRTEVSNDGLNKGGLAGVQELRGDHFAIVDRKHTRLDLRPQAGGELGAAVRRSGLIEAAADLRASARQWR